LALLREAERLRAQAVGFLAHADENEIAAVRGFLSPSRMIAFETRVSNDDAHNIARAASFVARHSLTGAALASGDVSLAQVDRLAAAARDLADAYERDEMELLAACGSRDVDQLKRFLAQWRWRNDRDASEADAQRSWNNRGVTIQERFDGSGTAQVSLEAQGFAAFVDALETRPDPTMGLEEPRSLKQRRADRLVELCHSSLRAHDHDDAVGGGLSVADTAALGQPSRSTVDVIIDIESLLGLDRADVNTIRAEFAKGTPLPTQVWERLLCDASVRRVITAGKSSVLDYGRATPVISDTLRRAVKRRDRHCQFHGCDIAADHCDVHHILAWHYNGETKEWNLVCLCRRHHRMIHQHGWTLTRHPDGHIETTSA
jgi:hypothetical protein